MRYPVRLAIIPLLCAASASFLPGCGGGSPPSGEAHKAIENAVLGSNTAAFEGGPESAEVSIDMKGWKKEEWPGGGDMPDMYSAEWTATLRFREPLAVIVVQINGTKVVRVIADEGEEMEFSGEVNAMKPEGKWEVDASTSIGIMDAGPWQVLFDKAGGVTMGYQVYDQGNMTVTGRGPAFQPLSALKPYVLEGSPEAAALGG